MKIDIERLATCEATLTVEVEPERLEAAKKAAARRLSEKHNVAGFRKGKAPYQIILRQFGEQAILENAVDQLGPKIYEEALDQAQIEPYATGQLTDVAFDPLVMKFTVPLKPEVDLGAYRTVRLPFTAPEVTDEAVQESLEHLREHHAVLEPVERPAQPGDVVTIDVVGQWVESDQPKPLIEQDGVSVLIDPKVEWPVPGFAGKLTGMMIGEQRQIDLTFPEDYENEKLRAKKTSFNVTASEIKSRYLPEWDDDLAKEVGEYETLEELRTVVRKELQERAEQAYEAEYSKSVNDIIVAGATVNYPPTLLQREIDNLADDLDHRLRERGLNLTDYMKLENKTQDSLREELRPAAEARLKRALVLGKVVDEEKIDLEPGEVEKHIESVTAAFGKGGERINKVLSTPNGKRSIALDLLTDKAVARLVAVAKGEAPEIPNPDTHPLDDAQPAEGEAQASAPESAGRGEPMPAAESTPLPESGGAS
ncbi:MAG: trigger factor [Chloroflexi bacterium]|nr:trigger factor [Chloroflexota bacterium]